MGLFSSIGNAVSKITPWNDKTEGIIPINHITPWNDNTTGGQLANMALMTLVSAGINNAMNMTKAAQLAQQTGAEAQAALKANGFLGTDGVFSVLADGEKEALQGLVNNAAATNAGTTLTSNLGAGMADAFKNPLTSVKTLYGDVKNTVGLGGAPAGSGGAPAGSGGAPAGSGGLFGNALDSVTKYAAIAGIGGYLSAKDQAKLAKDLKSMDRVYGGSGVANTIAANMKSPTAKFKENDVALATDIATKAMYDKEYLKGFTSAASKFVNPELANDLTKMIIGGGQWDYSE